MHAIIKATAFTAWLHWSQGKNRCDGGSKISRCIGSDLWQAVDVLHDIESLDSRARSVLLGKCMAAAIVPVAE